MSSSESSKSLAAAVEQAKRDGVKVNSKFTIKMSIPHTFTSIFQLLLTSHIFLFLFSFLPPFFLSSYLPFFFCNLLSILLPLLVLPLPLFIISTFYNHDISLHALHNFRLSANTYSPTRHIKSVKRRIVW